MTNQLPPDWRDQLFEKYGASCADDLMGLSAKELMEKATELGIHKPFFGNPRHKRYWVQ